MKITDIEIIPIYPRLAKRYDNPDAQARMANIDCRTVFKVTTDVGIVGYGDYYWADPVPASEIEPLIDRSPFDFMLADLNLGLGAALYDAMGKYLDVPVYKLLGQKVRDAGAVAAWTRPCSAEIFAGEIRRAVDDGYRVFKMHTSPEFDPLLQAEAAADVAPDGFRIHYDFNGYGRTLGVLKKLRLVSETDLGAGESIYEWLHQNRHHHLICRMCDRLIQLDHQYMANLGTEILDDYGFKADVDHIAIFGLCSDCTSEPQSNGNTNGE